MGHDKVRRLSDSLFLKTSRKGSGTTFKFEEKDTLPEFGASEVLFATSGKHFESNYQFSSSELEAFNTSPFVEERDFLVSPVMSTEEEEQEVAPRHGLQFLSEHFHVSNDGLRRDTYQFLAHSSRPSSPFDPQFHMTDSDNSFERNSFMDQQNQDGSLERAPLIPDEEIFPSSSRCQEGPHGPLMTNSASKVEREGFLEGQGLFFHRLSRRNSADIGDISGLRVAIDWPNDVAPPYECRHVSFGCILKVRGMLHSLDRHGGLALG